MGYKLSGFDLIGCCEIDPKMLAVYKANLKPRLSFLESVATLRKRDDLPQELFELDVLDGSPPCTSFSSSGLREKTWNKKKKFTEGQATQILDSLFFEFIQLAKKLQPKVIVAENVIGLISGKAKGYTKEILQGFADAGYRTQLFKLNAANMGVPQTRQRVFFVSQRNDFKKQPLTLRCNESPIPVSVAFNGLNYDDDYSQKMSSTEIELWKKTPAGSHFGHAHERGSYFSSKKLHAKRPSQCLTATERAGPFHWEECRKVTAGECLRIQTFPDDYQCDKKKSQYICGMSVPPIMMQRISSELFRQWFSK